MRLHYRRSVGFLICHRWKVCRLNKHKKEKNVFSFSLDRHIYCSALNLSGGDPPRKNIATDGATTHDPVVRSYLDPRSLPLHPTLRFDLLWRGRLLRSAWVGKSWSAVFLWFHLAVLLTMMIVFYCYVIPGLLKMPIHLRLRKPITSCLLNSEFVFPFLSFIWEFWFVMVFVWLYHCRIVIYVMFYLSSHPDKNPDPESKKLFVKIATAYEVIDFLFIDLATLKYYHISACLYV